MSRRHRADLRRLQHYAEACRGLLADLGDVLADLRFQKEGGRLYLAADFSEIYAFALPGDGAREMVHFGSKRELEMGLAIEASALETIFFGQFGEVALLDPYRIELHNFMRRLESSQLERTADHLLQALAEVRDLLDRDETREMDALHAKLESGEKLSEEEITRAIAYFDRHAPALVLFATRGPDQPAARLRHLLQDGHLATAESLFGGEPEAAPEEEIREIFEHLEKTRRKPSSGANYLDAAALAQVAAINRSLEAEKARLLLVSRSSNLAETLDALGLHEVHLRHPRTWSAFFRPPLDESADAIDEVAARRSALGLFVESARQHLKRTAKKAGRESKPSIQEMEQTADLIRRLESMVEEWLLGQRVLMSGHLDANHPEAAHLETDPGRVAADPERRVAHLLEMVADDSRIFEEVRGRLEHLSRDHQDLGWWLQSAPASSREIIDSRLVLEGFEGKTVFSPTTADSIQYTIQFSSDALRGALRGFDDRWLVRFDQLRSLLFEGLAQRDAYERLLAMAYTLGLLGRWQLAEKYAKAALDEAAAGGPSAHEGHFFLAVCQRKYRRSRQRLDAGVAHLHIAKELKREHLDDPSYDDPRYLKEEATLLQVERSLLRFHKDAETAEQRRRAVARIEELLERAIERARQDRYLLAQSYNGLCYLYLTEGAEYREPMRRYRDKLEAELETLLHDPGTWPANCVDTLCWAHFADRGADATTAELEEWADRLESVADKNERPLLAREDRQRVWRHAALIRKAIDKRREQD